MVVKKTKATKKTVKKAPVKKRRRNVWTAHKHKTRPESDTKVGRVMWEKGLLDASIGSSFHWFT